MQSLGCVPAVPGYFQAMKAVCQRYGALFILDEVMSGMGRCGTLHAWEQEGVVPDIQTIAKGLGGGYAPISGVLIAEHIVQTMDKGTGAFRHFQTYQGHPIACAAALAVQRVIQEENLLENVKKMGDYLEKGLKERLGGHPHVGDIRGKGLFWGVRIQSISIAWITLLTCTDRIRQRQEHKGALRSGDGYRSAGPRNGLVARIWHLAVCCWRNGGWNPRRSYSSGAAF